eukprot:UN05653
MQPREWQYQFDRLKEKAENASRGRSSRSKKLLEDCDYELTNLKTELLKMRSNIGENDYKRRLQRYNELQNNVNRWLSNITGKPVTRGWKNKDLAETHETYGMNNNEVLQQVDDRMESQDQHLDEILDGVKK